MNGLQVPFLEAETKIKNVEVSLCTSSENRRAVSRNDTRAGSGEGEEQGRKNYD